MSEIAWFSGCQAASHSLSGIVCLSATYFRKDRPKFLQLFRNIFTQLWDKPVGKHFNFFLPSQSAVLRVLPTFKVNFSMRKTTDLTTKLDCRLHFTLIKLVHRICAKPYLVVQSDLAHRALPPSLLPKFYVLVYLEESMAIDVTMLVGA